MEQFLKLDGGIILNLDCGTNLNQDFDCGTNLNLDSGLF